MSTKARKATEQDWMQYKVWEAKMQAEGTGEEVDRYIAKMAGETPGTRSYDHAQKAVRFYQDRMAKEVKKFRALLEQYEADFGEYEEDDKAINRVFATGALDLV